MEILDAGRAYNVDTRRQPHALSLGKQPSALPQDSALPSLQEVYR